MTLSTISGVGNSRAVLRLLRPKQWPKNLLVFGVPLAAGELSDVSVLKSCVVALVAFVFTSVAVYIANDLRDVKLDRLHPQKQFRPLASGEVSRRTAILLCALFLGAATIISRAFVEEEFMHLLALYLLLQIGYQLGLKHVPLIELTIVSSGFVIRAVAGGVAASIPLTPWFVSVVGATSLFALSAKRYSELKSGGVENGSRPVLAAYTLTYLQLIWSIMLTCSIIFYALWAVGVGDESGSNGVYSLFSVVPFSLLLMRYAVHADRGTAESPEAILFKDRTLQVVAIVWFILYWIYSA